MKNNSQKDEISSHIQILCSYLKIFRDDFIKGAVAFGSCRAKDISDEYKPKDQNLPDNIDCRLRISYGTNQHIFHFSKWTGKETCKWPINNTGIDDYIKMLYDIWQDGNYSWLVEKPDHVELLNKKADVICELSKPLLKEKEYRSISSKVRAIIMCNGSCWTDRLSAERSYPDEIEDVIKELESTNVKKLLEPEQNDKGNKIMITSGTSKKVWEAIRSEYDISKTSFGKKINFVSDPFTKKIIFRDVEQAFVLASQGFAKPALILAGGVIEELLKQYLKCKNIKPKNDKFFEYINVCEKNRLLKHGVSRLSDSIRDFRNLVHISAEKTKRYTISKATAKGAVSSIFTIANDFQID
ncbi:MAG: hypothetical protein JXA96_17495 [Sedimentisphaerales bacterium]|nr:hypothetical protein [Sedimentisphaerales bacterium]